MTRPLIIFAALLGLAISANGQQTPCTDATAVYRPELPCVTHVTVPDYTERNRELAAALTKQMEVAPEELNRASALMYIWSVKKYCHRTLTRWHKPEWCPR
jgi:hypothetical protein